MKKDENPGPQPGLFEEFDLAKDGSGFFLANGEFYEFDEFGGFYDKWKNYYDKDGQPGEAPENEDDYEDINSDEEDGPDQDSNPKKDQSEPNPLKQIEQEIEVMVEEYEDSTEGNDHTYDDYEKIFNQNLRNEERKNNLRIEVYNSDEKTIEFVVKGKFADANELKTYLGKNSNGQLEIMDIQLDAEIINGFYVKTTKASCDFLIQLEGEVLEIWLKNTELDDEYESIDSDQEDNPVEAPIANKNPTNAPIANKNPTNAPIANKNPTNAPIANKNPTKTDAITKPEKPLVSEAPKLAPRQEKDLLAKEMAEAEHKKPIGENQGKSGNQNQNKNAGGKGKPAGGRQRIMRD